MNCFEKNQCNGTPGVCPQKRLTPIKAPVFLLAALIMLSMATVAIAQSQQWVQQSPPTLEEERIVNNCVLSKMKFDPVVSAELQKDLEHYMRDGCKRALAGDWRWDNWGDIVTITYDEQNKVFLGDVKRPVQMALKPGHRLFKVYFPKIQHSGYSFNCGDIYGLRALKSCFNWHFTGTEFSFEQRTKKPTVTDLLLIMQGDRIEYKVEKDAYYLTRIK